MYKYFIGTLPDEIFADHEAIQIAPRAELAKAGQKLQLPSCVFYTGRLDISLNPEFPNNCNDETQ